MKVCIGDMNYLQIYTVACFCPHRKLAKSTLVLVLVFGIHYIIFVGMPHTFQGPSWEIRMYCELFFNSFQVLSAYSSEMYSKKDRALFTSIFFFARHSTEFALYQKTLVKLHLFDNWMMPVQPHSAIFLLRKNLFNMICCPHTQAALFDLITTPL